MIFRYLLSICNFFVTFLFLLCYFFFGILLLSIGGAFQCSVSFIAHLLALHLFFFLFCVEEVCILKRHRKFELVLYPDSESYNIDSVLDSSLSYFPMWAYCLHDSDIAANGRKTTMDIIAAHNRDNMLASKRGTNLFRLIQMSVVKRIVFCYDSGC